MAAVLATFTIEPAEDGYLLHIEDDDGQAIEFQATAEQLDLIAEAIDEHHEDDFEDIDDLDDFFAAVGKEVRRSVAEVLPLAPTHRELRELIAREAPVPPAVDDCGAQDWSELDQRMHYLVHLFRAYHEDATLASPPFTPAQVELLKAGIVPDGEL